METRHLLHFRDGESKSYQITMPDSITTWIIQAVGVSPLYGMCVADHKNIVTRRHVFVDVVVPYSVRRNEQVAMQATVYNYDGNERSTEVV